MAHPINRETVPTNRSQMIDVTSRATLVTTANVGRLRHRFTPAHHPRSRSPKRRSGYYRLRSLTKLHEQALKVLPAQRRQQRFTPEDRDVATADGAGRAGRLVLKMAKVTSVSLTARGGASAGEDRGNGVKTLLTASSRNSFLTRVCPVDCQTPMQLCGQASNSGTLSTSIQPIPALVCEHRVAVGRCHLCRRRNTLNVVTLT
jgi:hypothetical protein